MDIKSISCDEEGRIYTHYIEHISDDDLACINNMLPWRCFTLDSKGRRLGQSASEKKRNTPQRIPDRRIVELNKRIPLDGLDVLEIGCFEGIHTIALAQTGARVIAVDSRIENVLKTIVRTYCFGINSIVFKCDVELESDRELLPEVDVVHHVGVLYHLVDPVSHLKFILGKTRNAVMLDTHYALDNEANNKYEVDGIYYHYKYYKEGGRGDAFSGMYDHAKWLTLDSISGLLAEQGFGNIDIAELRDERNGARALIYAQRTGY